jgi:hypothetical protein
MSDDEIDPIPLDDELAGLVDTDQLADQVRALRDHVGWLTDRIHALEEQEGPATPHQPAPWVVYTPPAAAEDPRHDDEDPGFTLINFVAWYNLTYAGLPGTRARPIPGCWPHHPGLAAEIATLAYSWRDAFIGRTAHPHRAQLWHHHTRPGFAERLTHEWVHPHCHDGRHRTAGAHDRPDRYGLFSEAADANAPSRRAFATAATSIESEVATGDLLEPEAPPPPPYTGKAGRSWR